MNRGGLTLFKPHPNHSRYAPGKMGESSAVVEGNPAPYLEWADVVISTGSKMEMDALLLGEKVICVGGGRFWGTGLSIDVKSLVELEEALRPENQGPFPRTAWRSTGCHRLSRIAFA